MKLRLPPSQLLVMHFQRLFHTVSCLILRLEAVQLSNFFTTFYDIFYDNSLKNPSYKRCKNYFLLYRRPPCMQHVVLLRAIFDTAVLKNLLIHTCEPFSDRTEVSCALQHGCCSFSPKFCNIERLEPKAALCLT